MARMNIGSPAGRTNRALTRRMVGAWLAGSGAAMLAACAGGSSQGAAPAGGTPAPATGDVSVLYYTSTQPAYQRMEKQEAAIKSLLPQIKLSMIATETSPSQKFVTMAAGDTAPDIVWLGTDFWALAPQGHFLVLDDLVARDRSFTLPDYYPQAIDMYRYKGKIMSLPYGVNTHVITYNKGMLDKAGIKYPTREWTLDDYTTLGRRLTSAPGVEPQTWGAWIWNLWITIWMHGGEFYDKNYTRSLMDQAPAIRGLQFYYDQNFGSLKIAPQTGTYHQLFGNSQLAITNVAPFGVPVLRGYQGADWDFLTMPWMPERKRGTWMSGEGYGVANATKNKDGSWAVLKYLCGRDAMANFYAPEFQAIPAVRPVAESAFVNAIPGKNARAFLESIEFATPYAGHPVVSKWGDVLNPMWNDVRDGKKSARDAAQEAAVKLNDLLKATPA
jgi:multiple sugar transport system substrate-binding protein